MSRCERSRERLNSPLLPPGSNLFLPFHLIWAVLKTINNLPVFVQLIIFLVFSPMILKHFYTSSSQPTEIVTRAALPNLSSPASPPPPENDLLLQILSFLLSSFNDPIEEQNQCMMCERVCHSWLRVSRALRQLVLVRRGGQYSDGFGVLGSTISKVYLYDDPSCSSEPGFFKDMKRSARCEWAIGVCPKLRELGMKLPLEVALEVVGSFA